MVILISSFSLSGGGLASGGSVVSGVEGNSLLVYINKLELPDVMTCLVVIISSGNNVGDSRFKNALSSGWIFVGVSS